ncbi:cell adhesion molecule Dscam2-like [Bicyclus anynana]|uniref:Cell adhesion molecule Dscam2-like n=1 Tax=Bicyclus anynana TaxID=110368 RepID=A0ABM3LG97_BICAN|nr:cell adhesion molecule Dscam2-like [Bicyclus anynana]
MEKAFDRVWHEGLIHKLRHTSNSPKIVRIIKSFLSNRRFKVKVQEELSQEHPATAGVPQGSCLSPALYSLFTDDIPTLPGVTLALYADDAAYVATSLDTEYAIKKLQRKQVNENQEEPQLRTRLRPGTYGPERIKQQCNSARGSLSSERSGITPKSPKSTNPSTYYKAVGVFPESTRAAVVRPLPAARAVAGARYVLAGGALLLRDVRASDAGAYGCLARHALSATSRRSPPARLAVLAAPAPAAPRALPAARELRVAPGAPFCLPCAARAQPAPQYAWYRERAGGLALVPPDALWRWAGGAALCTARAEPQHAGAWLCKAHNALGEATVRLRVLVLEDFTVSVEPAVLCTVGLGASAHTLVLRAGYREPRTFFEDKVVTGDHPPYSQWIAAETEKSGTCRIDNCRKRHHSLLHPEQESQSRATSSIAREPVESARITTSAEPIVSCLSTQRSSNSGQVLLATALVKAESETGDQNIRALIDQGSQACFITESAVKRLQLKKTAGLGLTNLAVGPIGAQCPLVAHPPAAVQRRLAQVAPPGSTVRFTCSCSEPAAALQWVRDGAALAGAAGPALVLRGVTRAQRGLYQCVARRGRRAERAAAELRLAGEPLPHSRSETEGDPLPHSRSTPAGEPLPYKRSEPAENGSPSAAARQQLRLFYARTNNSDASSHCVRATATVPPSDAPLSADSAPELLYTFIEQALRGGGGVALRCVAAGAPPPRVAWLLDGQPLERFLPPHRYSVREEASAPGEVASTLNVSAAAPGDGGRYTCRASNALGAAEHSARLNIYGPPTVRALGAARAVAGDNFTLHCPYAGYPISSVTWRRRGAAAALPAEGRVAARGAELRLAPAQAHDAGHYACSVAAPAGPVASAELELLVRNPPKISPFLFSSELAEGSAAQVLCGVSSGDRPLYFSWLKDGAPLPPALQVEEKHLNDFSLLMFPALSARHSGAYTCRVANHAAAATYTAALSVRVPPAWRSEPRDAGALLGAPLRLPCAAAGRPPPLVAWARRAEPSGADGPERWEPPGPQWEAAADGALVARAAARAHRGLYRCSADNGVGAPLVKLVTVAVHEPPHFEAGAAPRNVSSVRGGGVELACEARGDPPLAVHWSHGGAALATGAGRWSLAEARRADGLQSLLRLRSAEPRDAGAYRCHARNPHGRADALFVLTVEEPPEAPRALRLAGAGERAVRVAWRARDAPGVHYAALCAPLLAPAPAPAPRNLSLERTAPGADADGYRLLRARVDGLRPAAAYALRVLAANRVGRSPPSDALLFTTLEEAPAAAPRDVRARVVAPEELLVSWAPPAGDWGGELLGYAVAWREVERTGAADGPREEGATGGTAVARGRGATQLTLGGLHPFARYSLSVRAFNRAGPGPPAPPVLAATADGAPEEPPRAVRCEAAGAHGLRVRWLPPPGPPPARYDVLFAAEAAGAGEARAAGGEALLGGLRAASEYAVRVRGRSERGAGPASPPQLCRTDDDVPGAVTLVRALPAGADAVRVSWAAPGARGGRLLHYTLSARERGAAAERSARVPADDADEAWLELRGLRAAEHEFWVRAATGAGAGPPSRAVSAAPQPPGAARVAAVPRELRVAQGARVRLRCAVLGAPPVSRRWAPLPRAHTVTDSGDLVIHKVEQHANYTCTARNALGADSATYALRVLRPPAPPALRLARAAAHALHLAWDAPGDGGAPLLGYTLLWWSGADAGEEAAARRWRAGAEARGAVLRGLACGAPYRVALRAHNSAGASPPSRPLLLRTRGDRAVAPAAGECIWANATALRVALLAWGGRCAVERFSLALREPGGAWRELRAAGGGAEAGGLAPGAWYELRVAAHAPAGDSLALFRAATLTADGERVGEPSELPLEDRAPVDVGEGAAPAAWWRGGAGAAAALLGAALALLLGAAALLACRGRRDAQAPSARPAERAAPRKPPAAHEISPYATFSMSSADAPRSCALHVRARSPHALGAAPPRPQLLAQPNDYGSARDSDSESSGSPCAACAAERYRAPPADSSAEDGSYHPPRARAPRRDHPAASHRF